MVIKTLELRMLLATYADLIRHAAPEGQPPIIEHYLERAAELTKEIAVRCAAKPTHD